MLKFETTECKRCAGTGRLDQYSRVSGGVCFKCSGTLRQLSAKGSKARKAYEAALTAALGVKASDVAIGDMIEDFHMGHPVSDVTVSDDGVMVFLHYVDSRGRGSKGMRSDKVLRRVDPSITERIAREIADTMPGATWQD